MLVKPERLPSALQAIKMKRPNQHIEHNVVAFNQRQAPSHAILSDLIAAKLLREKPVNAGLVIPYKGLLLLHCRQ
jgi:hypothetical protein